MQFQHDKFNMSGNNPNYYNRPNANSIPYPTYPMRPAQDRRIRNNFQPPSYAYSFPQMMPTIFQQQNNYFNHYSPSFMPESLIQAMNSTTARMFNQYPSKPAVNHFQRAAVPAVRQHQKPILITIPDDQDAVVIESS